jgi:hypothetical protein
MDKRWLSQLLDDSAFPVLALAVAVSQMKVGHHKMQALRDRWRQTMELLRDDRFQQNAEKYGSHTQTGSSPVAESTGSNKESAHYE